LREGTLFLRKLSRFIMAHPPRPDKLNESMLHTSNAIVAELRWCGWDVWRNNSI